MPYCRCRRTTFTNCSARYESAMAEHGYDSLLIASGAAPYRYGDDQAWHFQGYGPFLHWTGLAGREHCWLWIRAGHRPVLWLFEPVDFWHANPALPEEPWQQSIEVRSSASPEAPLLDDPGSLAVIGDPAQLSGLIPGEQNPEALLWDLDETRVLKTPYEIECLAQANRLALAGPRGGPGGVPGRRTASLASTWPTSRRPVSGKPKRLITALSA